MKKQLLIAGIICGIICAACVFLYTEMVYAEADSKRSEALERYGGEQVEVVVATRTIHPGETLDPSNCTTKTWLSDLLPDGALMELSEMEGKQATSLILEGEVVSQSRFNNETQELDIPAGYVAIALPAEDIQEARSTYTPPERRPPVWDAILKCSQRALITMRALHAQSSPGSRLP